MLPQEVEDEILAAGEDSWDDQVRAWRNIMRIGWLWSLYPNRRSKEHQEVVARLASVARRKRPTQAVYSRLHDELRRGEEITGSLHIPRNIDHSTARCIIEHEGTYEDIAMADERSWTLAQARLWAQSRTRMKSDKPVSLWKHLTKATPDHIRRTTAPVDESEAVHAFRQALREWNERGKEETPA